MSRCQIYLVSRFALIDLKIKQFRSDEVEKLAEMFNIPVLKYFTRPKENHPRKRRVSSKGTENFELGELLEITGEGNGSNNFLRIYKI